MGILYAFADSDELDERIEHRGTFTDTVGRGWKLPQIDVCLISSAGSDLDYACLLARGEMVATYKRRVRFTDFVSLGEPVPMEALIDALPARLRQHVTRPPTTIPPKTWDALFAQVKKVRPLVADDLDQLRALARDPSPIFRRRGAENLALERDALAVALLAAGIDRSDLVTWRDPNNAAPFLQGLKQKGAIEDRLVDYDASVFAGWELVDRDASGWAVFEDGPNRLTAINVNRTDVEHALGVDLVYYNHRFRSFVLVQYKRMKKESGLNVYRPDRSLARELKRMRLVPVSTESSGRPVDYRLNPGSCYLKLCPDIPFRPREHDLIRGMYLPLGYWDELAVSGAIAGPRQGLAVTFERAERHLNSSLFAALLRDGWIGSRAESTELLERVVTELLDEGHSVTLAEHAIRK